MPARTSLIGLTFGRLKVIAHGEPLLQTDGARVSTSLCQCECGNQKVIRNRSLKDGSTNSCGCLTKESTSRRMKTHGQSNSRIYQVWCGMIARCTNPNHASARNYYTRGIRVCERWMKFENFIEDMGHGQKGFDLDRRDNSLGYFKENCRWVTRRVNTSNTRSSIMVTVNGITGCVSDLCNQLHLNRSTIFSRIYAKGWSPEKAILTPIRKRKEIGISNLPPYLTNFD
jgi:hypothetical protein